jgi:hypothetical protein
MKIKPLRDDLNEYLLLQTIIKNKEYDRQNI